MKRYLLENESPVVVSKRHVLHIDIETRGELSGARLVPILRKAIQLQTNVV